MRAITIILGQRARQSSFYVAQIVLGTRDASFRHQRTCMQSCTLLGAYSLLLLSTTAIGKAISMLMRAAMEFLSPIKGNW